MRTCTHTHRKTHLVWLGMWTCRPLLLRTFECTLRWAAQPRRLASWGFFKVRLQCLGFLSFSACFLLLFFLCVFAITTKRNFLQRMLVVSSCCLPLLLQLQFLHARFTYNNGCMFFVSNHSIVLRLLSRQSNLSHWVNVCKNLKETSPITR